MTAAARAEHESTIRIYSSSVIPSNPRDPRVYQVRGFAYFSLGQNELALADYTDAIRFAPNFSDHYRSKASVYTVLEQYEKARGDLDIAIKLSPQRADTYLDRAAVHWKRNDYPASLEDYRKAAALAPNDAAACHALAWFFIHCPEEKLRDAATAVQLAQRACGLTAGQEPAYLKTLEAARQQTEAASQPRPEPSNDEFKSLRELLKQRP